MMESYSNTKNNKAKALADVGYTGERVKCYNDFEIQKKIGEEQQKTQGFIRNLIITPRDGKDSMYKFQLRYLDKDDNIIEPDTWYSGFKNAPGLDGDYVVFTYKINGIYNNVQDILDIKFTHESVDINDKNEVKQIELELKTPKLVTIMDGSITNITNVSNEPIVLSDPYKALLLNATIQLCIKRGTLTDEEIKAQYDRFLKII
jgi:hypothetical protein